MSFLRRVSFCTALVVLCLLIPFSVHAEVKLQAAPPSLPPPTDSKSAGVIKVSLLNDGKPVKGSKITATVLPVDAAILSLGNPVTDDKGEDILTIQAGPKPGSATITISAIPPVGITGTNPVPAIVKLVPAAAVPSNPPLTQPATNLPTVTDIFPKSIDIRAPISPWNGKAGEKVADEQFKRFVVTGSNFPADPTKITLQIGDALADTTAVEPDGSRFYAALTKQAQFQKLSLGTKPIQVTYDNNEKVVVVNNPTLAATGGGLFVNITSRAVDFWLTVVVLLAAIVLGSLLLMALAGIARSGLKDNTDIDTILGTPAERKERKDWLPRNLAKLLLDVETNTYSLARAQFLWWLSIIIYGWIFLFIGRWVIEGSPGFIPLEGFAYTFLISLSTLIAAKAVTAYRGTKGAGDVHPTPSDFVVQGGVVALDRIQQVAWNLVIGVAFVTIILVKYDRSSGFPTIPVELLALMGISAAGYIGGKAARQPGPNISRVEALPTTSDGKGIGPYLVVYGDHLSHGNTKAPGFGTNDKMTDIGATVQFARTGAAASAAIVVAKEKVATQDFDSDQPGLFARTLKIDLSGTDLAGEVFDAGTANPSLDDFWKKNTLVIVNADGQRASYAGPLSSITPPVPPPPAK